MFCHPGAWSRPRRRRGRRPHQLQESWSRFVLLVPFIFGHCVGFGWTMFLQGLSFKRASRSHAKTGLGDLLVFFFSFLLWYFWGVLWGLNYLQATASAADLSSPRCFDDKMLEPAAPIETFARFQAGFLSSEDFHRFLSIFIDFMIFIDFHRF